MRIFFELFRRGTCLLVCRWAPLADRAAQGLASYRKSSCCQKLANRALGADLTARDIHRMQVRRARWRYSRVPSPRSLIQSFGRNIGHSPSRSAKTPLDGELGRVLGQAGDFLLASV
jgi:hypothetical protein